MNFQIVAVGKRWDVVAERSYVAGTPNRPSIIFKLSSQHFKCSFHWVIATSEWVEGMNGHLPVHYTIACLNALKNYVNRNKETFAVSGKL